MSKKHKFGIILAYRRGGEASCCRMSGARVERKKKRIYAPITEIWKILRKQRGCDRVIFVKFGLTLSCGFQASRASVIRAAGRRPVLKGLAKF